MKKKHTKKGKITCIAIVIIVIIMIIFFMIDKNRKKNKENNDIEPIIYYNLNDIANMPLVEEKGISQNVKITWPNECKGEIKKDGKKFSQEEGKSLEEEGTYTITVTSPSGKKVTQTIIIDKTPPKVEVKKNSSGTYTIIFDDTNDVEIATITKLDIETKQLVSETDLTKDGLKEKIEIKEKGYYILKIEDRLGNTVNENIKFKIK